MTTDEARLDPARSTPVPAQPVADPARAASGLVRNGDVDWDEWPVEQYLHEIYEELHPADAAVIDHHNEYYRRLEPGSLARSLEFGAGPNLYPLMLASACSRQIDALEPSEANLAYLRRQLGAGPDEHWRSFYAHCRHGNPTLPPTLEAALERVRVRPGSGLSAPEDTYDLCSMHFVAEGVTEDRLEFEALSTAFIRAARPGGHLVAAFMENLPSYRLEVGPQWPGYPVNGDIVREVFGPHTDDLVIDRIGTDPTLPEYGESGMILMTARRRR